MPTDKEKQQIREEYQASAAETYDAALAANKDIQDGFYPGGMAKGADPMNPPRTGSHFVPYSQSLGQGGSHFQDGNQTKIVQIMREADKAYREVGIVRNVIDLMTDFTSEGLNVHHPVAQQERFYRAWIKKVGMEEIAKQTLRGMYKWANVGIFRFWGKIKPKTRKEMMAKARELFAQGENKEGVKAFLRDDKTFKKGRIPIRYSCLPPFRIRIFGSLLFDTRVYYFAFPENDKMRILNPQGASTWERKLIDNLPDSLKQRISRDAQVQLPEENFTMVHFKRDCSRMWADPLILPIMNDLRFKQVLRRMDISVAESIINPITIFKLGKTVEGFGPNKEQFQNLATLLKTPVATKTLVWSDLIEVEQHIVDAKEVFSMEKYQEVDLDILNGLGVSTVLINGGVGTTGGGRAAGNAFLSVRGLLERLEDGRQEFMKFLNSELDTVRRAMGWKKAPRITWDQMSLRDEAAEKRIAIELRDRKVISNESLLDFLGMDNEIEMSRKGREEKVSDRTGIPQSVGPFEEAVRVQKDEDPARLTVDVNKDAQDLQERMGDKQLEHQTELKDKDIQMQKEVKKEQVKNSTAPKAGPGRKPNQGDSDSRKQKKRRSDIVKPAKSSVDADLIEQALANRTVIEHYLKPRILKSLEKENLRQLTKDEKKTYEQLIESVWAFSSPQGRITGEWVEEMADQVASGLTLTDDPWAKDSVDIYHTLILDYRNQNLKAPSTQIRRELFARAQILSEK
jgi:hypothetical protein